MSAEASEVRLLLPDAERLEVPPCRAYTVEADGHLQLLLEDGTSRTFLPHEWMDIRFEPQELRHFDADTPG